MTDIRQFSANAAANTLPPPDGFPEGMAPSAVNDAARELMAAIRRQHEQAEWIDLGHTPSFVDATTFRIVGIADLDTYAPTRRVRLTVGATRLYGTIVDATPSGADTLCSVLLDAGALTGSLSAVAVHIVSPSNVPPPHHLGDIWDVAAPDPLDDRFLMHRSATGGLAWRPTQITDLPECTTPDPVFDYLLGWDASEAGHRRYKLDGVGGGSGGGVYSSGNFFGTGADGAFSSTGDTVVGDANYDNEAVIKHYTTFTLNAGHSFTVDKRKKCLLIYVQQDCVINGTLHMDRRGAKATAQDIVIKRITQTAALLPNEVEPTSWTIPLTGATGGAGGATGVASAGNNGSAGVNGQTGGGGGGGGGAGGSNYGAGGAGASGSAFCGGSGGGAGGHNGSAGVAGSAGAGNGGAGGNAGPIPSNWHSVATGGAGNINGISNAAGSGFYAVGPNNGGGGGTLILIVGGTLSIGLGAVISADGGTSAAGTSVTNNTALTGGGAGGGCVLIVHAGALTNAGTIRAAGGASGIASGGTYIGRGGNGGAGSVIGPVQITA